MPTHGPSGARERGEGLADRGMVSLASVSDTVVQARVQGTVRYRVTLMTGDKRSWACDCPAAANGSFCKHRVAVVLTLVEPATSAGVAPESGDRQPTEADRIEAHVRSLGAEALADIVLEQVSIDEQLGYRMLAAATAEADETIDLREWKKRVTAVIDVLVALGEIERAWSMALEFGAESRRWSHLVALRADDHPHDAVDWAMVAAEMEIDRKGRPQYRRAVKHLRAAQALAASHDGAEHGPLSRRFHMGVRSIVEKHSNKPSLLDEFAKAGWPQEELEEQP